MKFLGKLFWGYLFSVPLALWIPYALGIRWYYDGDPMWWVQMVYVLPLFLVVEPMASLTIGADPIKPMTVASGLYWLVITAFLWLWLKIRSRFKQPIDCGGD